MSFKKNDIVKCINTDGWDQHLSDICLNKLAEVIKVDGSYIHIRWLNMKILNDHCYTYRFQLLNGVKCRKKNEKEKSA